MCDFKSTCVDVPESFNLKTILLYVYIPPYIQNKYKNKISVHNALTAHPECSVLQK